MARSALSLPVPAAHPQRVQLRPELPDPDFPDLPPSTDRDQTRLLVPDTRDWAAVERFIDKLYTNRVDPTLPGRASEPTLPGRHPIRHHVVAMEEGDDGDMVSQDLP